MAVVIARLHVPDFDTWYAEYQQMHARRHELGERGHRLHRDVDDSSAVVVVFEWDTVENAKDYFGSAELTASVSRAKAAGLPQVTYLELVDDGSSTS
jgi:heme-degrading monooxygenase HmoA